MNMASMQGSQGYNYLHSMMQVAFVWPIPVAEA